MRCAVLHSTTGIKNRLGESQSDNMVSTSSPEVHRCATMIECLHMMRGRTTTPSVRDLANKRVDALLQYAAIHSTILHVRDKEM
ncbi:unnamed protein product [Hydatigera taeniaeformis]|uniref:Uncharacterized protein n=1 Tax=Hydatigena taeniaeformis TaxID=6205 RepID=A0A0R3X8H3_HYDTA|nr:unnamed protein product [Hydatigera taeniaeformis]